MILYEENIMKVIIKAALLAALFFTSIQAFDKTATEELMKQDLRAARRELVASNIKIKDQEKSKLFWQIYDEYVASSKELVDAHIELLQTYAKKYEKMDDGTANKLIAESFKISEQRHKLNKKTHKKLASKVSPIVAARFTQLNNRINILLDFQIASKMPLLLPEGVSTGKAKKIIEVRVEE